MRIYRRYEKYIKIHGLTKNDLDVRKYFWQICKGDVCKIHNTVSEEFRGGKAERELLHKKYMRYKRMVTDKYANLSFREFVDNFPQAYTYAKQYNRWWKTRYTCAKYKFLNEIS